MPFFFLHLQALSINRSLSKAKFAVERGQVSSKELRNSVIQAIEEAGGKVDYAEVRFSSLLSLTT